MAAAALEQAHGWPAGAVALTVVSTSGDRIQDRPLAEIGGKALWTKELDRALAGGRDRFLGPFDEGCRKRAARALRIAAMLPRADVRDRLIGAGSIDELPHGARGRHQLAAPRRAVAAASPRPRTRPDPRQCRHPAGQARRGRGRRDPARRGRARPAGARRGRSADRDRRSCCPRRRRARSGSNAAPDDARAARCSARSSHRDTFDCGRGRARLHPGAGRHLPFAGRGAGRDRGRAASTCAAKSSAPTAPSMVAASRRVRARRSRRRRRRWRGDMLAARAAVDPRLFEGVMKPLVLLRPEPGLRRQRRAGARRSGLTRDRMPVVRGRAGGMGSARPPAQFDGLLLTSANAVRHGGDGLEQLRGSAGPSRSARRPPRRRAAAGLTVEHDRRRRRGRPARRADPAIAACSTLPAQTRRRVGAARSPSIAVYRAVDDRQPALARPRPVRWSRSTARAPGARLAELGRDRRGTAIAAISAAAAAACGDGLGDGRRPPTSPTTPRLLALAARLCQDFAAMTGPHRPRAGPRASPGRCCCSWSGPGLAIWGLSRWQDGARFLGVAPAARAGRASPSRRHRSRRPSHRRQRPRPMPTRRCALEPAGGGRTAPRDRRGLGGPRRRAAGRLRRAAGDRSRGGAGLSRAAAGRTLRTEPASARWRRSSPRRGTPETADRTDRAIIEALGTDAARARARTKAGGPGSAARSARWSRCAAPTAQARAPARATTGRWRALRDGKVDAALAETMRLPGATGPKPRAWIDRARRQVAGRQRALDEMESAALLGDRRGAATRRFAGAWSAAADRASRCDRRVKRGFSSPP